MAQTLAINHNRSKTRKELYTLSKLQLIKKCKASNVPINGNKSEMIDRLLANNDSNNFFDAYDNHKHTVTTEPLSPPSTPSKDTYKPLSFRSLSKQKLNKHKKRNTRPTKLRLNSRRSDNPHRGDRNPPKPPKRHKSHSPHRVSKHIRMKRLKTKKDNRPRSKSKKATKGKKIRNKGRNRFSSRAQVPPGDMVLVIGSHAFREFGMAQDKTLITLTQLTPLIPSDAQKNITRIYSGYYYSYYTDDILDKIWSAGYNLHGELACGKTGNLILPLTEVNFFKSHEPEILLHKLCVNVSSWTVFWITDNYKLYGNGMNDDYQLGLGGRYYTDHQFEPVLVKQLYDLPIIDVQCAHKYSIALSGYNEDIICRIVTYLLKQCEDVNQQHEHHQTAFSFGSLSSSSFYHNKSHPYRYSHFNVIFSEDIMKIIMMYCDKRQSVWSTGFNEYGGGGVAKCQLKELQELQELKLEDSASAIEAKWRELTVLNDKEIVSISTGYEHTLFLSADGTILSCGDNEYGQLGLSMEAINKQNILNNLARHRSVERDCIHIPMEITSFTVKVTEIKCGMYHSMCIDQNNNVWSWGNGKFGQCGHGEFKDRGYFKPKMIEWFANSGHKIDRIDCGNSHSYCRTTNEMHFIFGSNKYSQCLDKKKKNLNIPWCFYPNKIISKKWKYKKIKDVFLGFDNTKIILCERN